MRHDKAALVLEMARMLAASAEGLTLDELGERLGLKRRTTERMRDAVWSLFPHMEVLEDPPTRRFRIPGGLDALFQAPTPDELAALRRAAEADEREGAKASAAHLRSLERKALAATRAQARRKLSVDADARTQAQAVAVHPGPRPVEDPTVLGPIEEAIVALRALAFDYGGRRREVTPYGLLFARSNYLVGVEAGQAEPKTFRLDRMSRVETLDRFAAPPEDFSLQAYADESFGIYRDEPEDVELLVRPEAAEDALRWRFHPTQSVEPLPDGSVRVRFRSRGMRELAWHLFSWSGQVRIVTPDRLRETFAAELAAARGSLT
jgi:predicted DNA-binding transcriptional regulator YafY